LNHWKAAIGQVGSAMLFFMILLPASAQPPVAVVEEVTGTPDSVEFMDYVAPGKVIRLGPNGRIVLGYLRSCSRESITSGTVTVGIEQSDVKDGSTLRTTVACDANNMQLSAETAARSAAMVLRDMNGKQAQAGTQPQFTLYGLSPVVSFAPATAVVIERIDVAGERYDLASETGAAHRAFYDFANSNKKLVPGGLYRASAGPVQIVFRVDPDAKAGRTPVVGRLLQLGPGS
jgi:hypothetical protein